MLRLTEVLPLETALLVVEERETRSHPWSAMCRTEQRGSLFKTIQEIRRHSAASDKHMLGQFKHYDKYPSEDDL